MMSAIMQEFFAHLKATNPQLPLTEPRALCIAPPIQSPHNPISFAVGLGYRTTPFASRCGTMSRKELSNDVI